MSAVRMAQVTMRGAVSRSIPNHRPPAYRLRRIAACLAKWEAVQIINMPIPPTFSVYTARFESDECDRSRRRFCFRGRACRFAADAVAQDQERQPEEPKRVISAQLAVGDVDIEFLFETRHPKCRQLT